MQENRPNIKVFKNAMILDCVHDKPFKGHLIVQDNLIHSVLDSKEATFPYDAKIYDLDGKFILPGLIDAHVHIICSDTDTVLQMRQDTVSLMTIKALDILKSDLDQGFTFVRECGGADAGFRIDCNPIDDVSILQNYEKNIVCIIKDGKFHKSF